MSVGLEDERPVFYEFARDWIRGAKRVSAIKFFVKWRALGALRSAATILFGARVNVQNWADRILVINLNALGDVVIFTSVLRHHKECFPNKKIYLLLPVDVGLDKASFGEGVDEIITVDHRKFGLNPFYAFGFINFLRRVGFKTIVNYGLSVTEIPGKIITVSLGAKEIVGYEGLEVQLKNPFDSAAKQAINFVRTEIFPHYTLLIPTLREDVDRHGGLHHFVRHYISIYEKFSGCVSSNYSALLRLVAADEKSVRAMLVRNGVAPKAYCVMIMGSRSTSRRWEVEKFAKVAEEIGRHGTPIVLAGASYEKELAEKFKKLYKGRQVDLVGKLSVPELIALIDQSLFVLTNDTAPVHIAVALKIPSLCVVGAGHLGMLSFYGYKQINRWVYAKTNCLFDNWRCVLGIPGGVPAPCISAIEAREAMRELRKLLKAIREGADKRVADRDFEVEFDHIPK